MPRYILLIAVLFLLHCSLAHADPKKNLVESQLLADVQTIQPGHPFTLGVLLHIEPGWHVYWKNPGDAGLPTRVQWTLPPGYTAGPLQYPVPERIESPGNVISYGYTDSVMLMATITPPADVSGKEAAIEAKISWLVCRDVCLPGKATQTLTLGVGPASQPANHELFETWSKQLPLSGDAPHGPAGYTVTGSLASDSPATFSLHLHWNDAKRFPAKVSFFPESDSALEIRDIQIDSRTPDITITFKATLLKGMMLSTQTLGAVVGYVGPDTGGIRVAIPLHPPA